VFDREDALQKRLQALEGESSPEQARADFSEESSELEELVSLAAAIRQAQHPVMSAQAAAVGKQRAAAALRRQTARRPVLVFWDKVREIFRAPQARAFSMGVAGLLVLLAFSISWASGAYQARAATLLDVTGQVEVASNSDAGDWRTVTSGERVISGQRLRTRPGARATVVFFDGSRSTVNENSVIQVSSLGKSWDGALQAVLTQPGGYIDYSIVPFRGNGFFRVYSPGGNVEVHGTHFSVDVRGEGWTRFTVNTGNVQIANAGAQVLLTAGQATTSRPGAGPETAAYQFEVQGELVSEQDQTWTVAGVKFQLEPGSENANKVKLGDLVTVTGRILSDSSGNAGIWLADIVEPAEERDAYAFFTGLLTSNTGGSWQIGALQVEVNADTILGSGLQVGSPVRVYFGVGPDGARLAAQITLLNDEVTDRVFPTTEPDTNPNAFPDLVFKPGEAAVELCDANLSASSQLVNEALIPKDIAVDVQLGYQVVQGAEYVDTIGVQPFTWAQIGAGQPVALQVNVTPTAAWASTADAVVKIRVFIAAEGNRPSAHHSQWLVTFTHRCGGEPTNEETSTPTVTTTASLTGTQTVTVTTTVTPTATMTPGAFSSETDCTGANPNPTGQALAQQYGVAYSEVLRWYCQGFGYGEIDLAYSISKQTGTPVAKIFQMKSSGIGWGDIQKQLLPGQGKPKPSRTPRK
jgi:hypothetical protein